MDNPHLKVFIDHSILVKNSGSTELFHEGPPDEDSKKRLLKIKKSFSQGWFEDILKSVHLEEEEDVTIENDIILVLNRLVDSVTSEVGRAVLGLFILQLAIKSIEPNQSVRLHKGGGGSGSFSWKEGVPMRTLDKKFITPILRKYGLLRLNADGFMMTRSLAENYPYTKFYKAAIRGAKDDWLFLVDKLEDNLINAEDCLIYIIGLLFNKSDNFKKNAEITIKLVEKYNAKSPSLLDIYNVINLHITHSTYSARLFEIAMHSLIQAIEENTSIEGRLLPLCQMRTANKKHNNIGDVEIVDLFNDNIIFEAWDAKYGKPYLRDEIEELLDKLEDKQDIEIVGFVTDREPDIKEEIKNRLDQINELTGVNVMILSFQDWIKYWIERTDLDVNELSKLWLIAYTESLCQKRRGKAPIDEPSDEWVESLKNIIQNKVSNIYFSV